MCLSFVLGTDGFLNVFVRQKFISQAFKKSFESGDPSPTLNEGTEVIGIQMLTCVDAVDDNIIVAHLICKSPKIHPIKLRQFGMRRLRIKKRVHGHIL